MQALWRALRHRPRSWRYISSRRRSTGLVLLALIVLCVYAYWHFTNDARIRELAEDYLETMTGADVRVAHAEFRLFGRVVLEDVSLRLPDEDARRPMLRARRIVLSHRPWALFASARFEPTRIVCTNTDIRLRYDRDGQSNIAQLRRLSRRRRTPSEGAPGRLPPIELRHVALFTPDDAQKPRMAFDMALRPHEGNLYELKMSETRRQSLVTMLIDVGRGESLQGSVAMDLSELGDLVPELREPIRQYVAEARGPCRIAWVRKGEKGTLVFDGAHLTLAGPLGGLAADEVTGTMRFERSGETHSIRLDNVAGRLLAAGAAPHPTATQPDRSFGQVTLTQGTYDAEGGGQFHATVVLENVDLANLPTTGPVGIAADAIRKRLRPAGRCDAEITIHALRNAPVDVSGTATLGGVSVRPKAFPHPVTDVSGTVSFDRNEAVLDATGTPAGGGTLHCEGTVALDAGRGSYGLSFRAEDIALNETLGDAMRAAQLGAVWRDIRPAGAATIDLDLSRDAGQATPTAELTLHPSRGGPLRVRHRFFPYPVSVTGGTITIRDRNVHIPAPFEQRPGVSGPIQAVAGPATFLLYGRIDNVGTDRLDADVTVEADKLPLDETLAEALSPPARKALRSLHAAGRLDNVQARLREKGDGGVQYDILADLVGVRLKPDVFPYALSAAGGQVRIRPEGLEIVELRGIHTNEQGKPSRARLTGHVSFRDASVDLAGRLEGAALEADLRDALPPELRRLWARFAPAGRADVTMKKYVTDAKGAPADFDIRLIPRDATFRYRHLPYRLQLGGDAESAGVITATPKHVTLHGLASSRAVDGARVRSLDGTIHYGRDEVTADLNVTAAGLPLEAERFAGLPEPLAKAAKRLRPAGRCDVRFEPLHLVWRWAAPHTAASRPATRPASRPATRPAQRELADWHMEGEAALSAVEIQTSAGAARIAGTVAGRVAREADGVAMTATARGVSISLDGTPRVKQLTAEVHKEPGKQRIFIKELFGRTFGGGVDGRGFVLLGEDPVRYHLLVTFDEMDLAKILAGEGPDVAGRLQGRMEITAAVGQTEGRRASGKLRISKARVSKLPVLLSALQVIPLTVPGESPVTDGFVEYRLADETLVFREIHLGGPAISIVGSGSMDLSTKKLRLTFLRTESAVLPRIDSIRELLEGIVREIVEVRVTGTLTDPDIRTVTAPSIRDAIRTILHPRRRSE